MGKVYSFFLRPIRTFNVENRAERVISRQKPIPAPQHSSVQKQKDLVDHLNPDFMENHYKKDPKLDNYLKNIYVSSTDNQSQKSEMTSTKPLPQNRSNVSPLDKFNYKPLVMIKGKCSVSEVLQLISLHQQNPVDHPVEKMAEQYGLDKQVAENVVQHFRILNVIDMEKMKKNKQLD